MEPNPQARRFSGKKSSMQSLEAILKLTEEPGQIDLGPDFEDQQNLKGEEVRFGFDLKFLQKQIFTAVFD